MIRGVRGAITVKENNEPVIVSSTEKLLKEVIKENGIDPEDVTSVFISVTEDITDAFPAKALRLIPGWTHVPVMCMREIPVPSALPLCIRVMIHIFTEKAQNEIVHVYLGDATQLRPDLLK
ncbi:chorismate mutase [Bacillus sp. T33-2]|uniref:chorismate mutase n=1 Tax=Bacillus sp. T33-2 TaxID=2054168 RepID=UPI000C787DED|nr:chorismate mutase [Bacillus sp. T33-2]PLR99742.1 chorismate mutase [Bacillus sp. T33-2]